ncbi:hypothetical protein BC834DRAFT_276263 [Gloeopeniophorella convolvens]|nr:hypothetical protein BC834DRAFT_276263 [Gloeopeniophorella convolvens]
MGRSMIPSGSGAIYRRRHCRRSATPILTGGASWAGYVKGWQPRALLVVSTRQGSRWHYSNICQMLVSELDKAWPRLERKWRWSTRPKRWRRCTWAQSAYHSPGTSLVAEVGVRSVHAMMSRDRHRLLGGAPISLFDWTLMSMTCTAALRHGLLHSRCWEASKAAPTKLLESEF